MIIRIFTIIFSIFFVTSCDEHGHTKHNNLDSTNGINEAEFKPHFIDSAMKKIK